MKLDTKLIFENLNKRAIEALKSKVVAMTNTAFDDPKKSLDGEHNLIIVLKGPKEDKNKAASIINEYFKLFSGDVNKINGNDLFVQKQEDGNIQYIIKYQMNWYKNLKENMKTRKTKMKKRLLTEADASFNITPGELLGKLHQAAMKEVESKYGKGVGLTNNAIDINQNPPVGKTEEGDYVIQIRLQDATDKKEAQKKTREVLQTYVQGFAGPDVAKTLAKPKWYQIRKKDKLSKDKDAAGELAGFSVHYHIGVAQANPEASTKSYWEKFKGALKGAKDKVTNSKLMQGAAKLVGNFKAWSKEKYDKSSVGKFFKDKAKQKEMAKQYQKGIDEVKDIEAKIIEDMTEQVNNKVDEKLSHEDWKISFTGNEIAALVMAAVKNHAKVLSKNLREPDKNKQTLEKTYDEIADEVVNEIKNKASKKANEAFVFTFEGCQSMIVEKQQMLTRINLITESVGVRSKYTLVEEGLLDGIKDKVKDMKQKSKEKKEAKAKAKAEKKAAKEHAKKIGFSISAATLIGKLHKAASNAFQKKYGKKCLIINTAINEDANPPQCAGDGMYKITVKQLKRGLFGSTKAAKEAIRLYLTTFAGEDVAKACLKAPFYMFGKSKLKKGEQKDNAGQTTGYTVYYDLKMAGNGTGSQDNNTNESFTMTFKNSKRMVVECRKQLSKARKLFESKPKATTTEKIVSKVMSNNFRAANEFLEEALARKVDKRINNILGE